MKKKFYAYIFIGLMTLAAQNAKAQTGLFKPSDLKKLEYAKKKYQDLTAGCRNCEQEVEKDTAYGKPYLALKKKIAVLTDSLSKVNARYDEALKLLQMEIERNPYNNYTERKDYKNRKNELITQRDSERNAIYQRLKALYETLASDQKTYWGLIVDRKVKKSMAK